MATANSQMRVPERTNALTLLGVAIELGSTALIRYCSTIVEANVVTSPSRVKIGSRCSLSNDSASRTAETPRYAARLVDEGREKSLPYLRASSSVEEEDNRDTGSAEYLIHDKRCNYQSY